MPDNYNFKDASGATQTMRAKDIGGFYSNRDIPQVADADVASGNPMPVSISGVSTAANQVTSNASLASIDGKIPSPVGGASPVFTPSSQIVSSVSFTRPADTTAYAAGDLIANSTTFGSVVALAFPNATRVAGETVRIDRVRIDKSGTGIANAQFRLHIFEDIPVPSVGDNAVLNNAGVMASNRVRTRVGSFIVVVANSGSDGACGVGIAEIGSAVTARPTSGTTLYGLLEAIAAYAPANAEVFNVTIEGFRT